MGLYGGRRSLGATLYTAHEGKPPFDGPTLTAVIAAILTREPTPAVQAGSLTDQMMPPTEPSRNRATDSTDSLSRPPDRPPARVRAATAGLWLTLVAGLTGIIVTSLATTPNPADSTILGDLGYVIAMVAAVAALVSAKNRQTLSYFVLGSWLIALSWVTLDILGVPDFQVLSRGNHYIAWYLLPTASDLAWLVAVAALLVALGRGLIGSVILALGHARRRQVS